MENRYNVIMTYNLAGGRRHVYQVETIVNKQRRACDQVPGRFATVDAARAAATAAGVVIEKVCDIYSF